jgi:hypothetical protein
MRAEKFMLHIGRTIAAMLLQKCCKRSSGSDTFTAGYCSTITDAAVVAMSEIFLRRLERIDDTSGHFYWKGSYVMTVPNWQFLPSHLSAQGFYLLRARTKLREITNILLK